MRLATRSKPLAALVLLTCASALACAPDPAVELRAGDLVFHRSRSAQSQVIAAVTGSPLTHVGIVLPHEGRLAVLEASGPVGWTSVPAFVARGEHGRYTLRRPRDTLSADDVAALVREGQRLLGTRYDARFEWGPRRVYCSELVYLLYERALDLPLVTPQRFAELSLTPAAQRLARRRLGRMPRPDERVVTPAALAASVELFEP